MKTKWNLLIISIASCIVLGIIVFTNDMSQLYQIFLNTKKLWLGLALFCICLYWVFESGILYYTANSIRRKLSFHTAFQTTMVGQLFNNLTPFSSGGQPMQLYYLTKSSFDIGEASSILLMKFIVYQATLIVYCTVLLFVQFRFFTTYITKLGYLIGLGFLVNLMVVIGLFLIGFFPGITTKITRGIISLLAKIHLVKKKEVVLEKATHHIEEFHDGFKLLMTQKKVMMGSVFITILQLTCFFLIPFCICMALQIHTAPLLSVIAASAFVLMISSFVPLPGASGGAEGSFYILFGIFLIQPGIIAVALLLWRFITYYLPILIGIFFCRSKKANVT